jgi:hypothetical protein
VLFLENTSVSETLKFIKQFHFSQGQGVDIFQDVTFSDNTKIRLSPTSGVIKLKMQSSGFFPDDADIWARTWITNPKAVRKLLMLEVFPESQPEYGVVNVRIYDGTNDYYWDGAAWSIAGTSDWNTEAEINANIDTFPILPNRQFAITLNLQTTDPDRRVTPFVSEVRVLMEVHIDYIEDIVFRSLMPLMENDIRPAANFGNVQEFTTDVSTINLFDYRINTPYRIVDVDRVYDFTDDPELIYNLFSDYDSGTGVITLTSSLPAGHKPFIVFRYVPEIAFITHQDWYEVSKLPCLIIQGLEVPVTSAYNITAREGVVDKGTGQAVVVHEPWRATIEFRLHGLTASAVDQMRLMSRVIKFFDDNKFIKSTGLDEYYRMRIEREFRDLSNPDRSDQRAFWTRFTIEDIRMPIVSEDTYGVKKVAVTFKGPKPAHEDSIKGGARTVIIPHSEDSPIEWTETIDVV